MAIIAEEAGNLHTIFPIEQFLTFKDMPTNGCKKLVVLMPLLRGLVFKGISLVIGTSKIQSKGLITVSAFS